MSRIVIFGNSGSGKSRLGRLLAHLDRAEYFDLDTIAWRTDQPSVRATFEESRTPLLAFTEQAERWVIEGCYSTLLREAAAQCTELIFLNPGIETCVENCMARPWEGHKYPTAGAQEEKSGNATELGQTI